MRRPIAVRRATVADAHGLSTLNREIQAGPPLPSLFQGPGPLSATEAAELLEITTNHVWFGYVADELAGYVYAAERSREDTSSMHPLRVMHLRYLRVRPAHRGRGVASALVEAVRWEAALWHIRRLELDACTFSDAARRFLVREGFEMFNERLWAAAVEERRRD